MENSELKNALLSRRPVIHNYPLHGAVKYSYVSAVIYRRNKNGGIDTEAELYDKCGHSVMISKPKYIRYAEEGE